MSQPFVEIEGFRCYAPDVALACDDYPSDGFDVTASIEASSFWCRTRNRVLHGVFDRFVERTRPMDILEIGWGTGNVLRFTLPLTLWGAFDVLERIDADEDVMRGVHRALRSGGLFIVTVPQFPWLWSTRDEIVEHKRRYRRKELVDKLDGAGFSVTHVTSFVSFGGSLLAVAQRR